MEINDAKVLVTGGGTGIGLATARLLADRGAKVAVCGRRQGPLHAAASEFGVAAIQADVSDLGDVQRLVAATVEQLGGYNVLINNAAIGYFAPLLDCDPDRMAEVLRVNVVGAMLVARESAQHFVAHGGGSIVNIGSTAANKGFPGGTAYAASKFALSALTECWRAELRKQDVRVMQVNPSEVITEFGRTGDNPRPDNPSKLHSEDVAHVIVELLALHDRGFVTDATLWATNPQ